MPCHRLRHAARHIYDDAIYAKTITSAFSARDARVRNTTTRLPRACAVAAAPCPMLMLDVFDAPPAFYARREQYAMNVAPARQRYTDVA